MLPAITAPGKINEMTASGKGEQNSPNIEQNGPEAPEQDNPEVLDSAASGKNNETTFTGEVEQNGLNIEQNGLDIDDFAGEGEQNGLNTEKNVPNVDQNAPAVPELNNLGVFDRQSY